MGVMYMRSGEMEVGGNVHEKWGDRSGWDYTWELGELQVGGSIHDNWGVESGWYCT